MNKRYENYPLYQQAYDTLTADHALTIQDVCARLGITPRGLNYWRKRQGLPVLRTRRFSEAEREAQREQIRADYAAGMTAKDIRIKYGCQYSVIREIVGEAYRPRSEKQSAAAYAKFQKPDKWWETS
jgi:DNA-binding transcriptional MerR regulator